MTPFHGLENHVFISYAQIDNACFTEIEKGWIDLFHEALNWRLPQLMGGTVKIWRDRKLGGNDVFDDTIRIALSRSAILLTVLSPRYLLSQSCREELDGFFQVSGENIRIDDKHRVFKVMKTHVPLEEHPAELQDMLGYPFYALDEASGRFREYDNDIGPRGEKDKRYWERLEDLAQDICSLLKRMGFGPPQRSPAPTGSTIYLAETSSDLSDERDKVKRELQQYGHEVLPDKALPLQVPLLQDAVRDYLQRSRLSVHLIGENYGIIPEMETDRSIVRLQEELAVERGDDDQFSRLIWLPPGLQPKDERQKRFVIDLQNSFTSSNGSELLQVKLEDLKSIIQSKLIQKSKPAAAPADETGAVRVYLICDKSDVDAVSPLQEYLFERRCEVTLPLSEGSETEVIEDHKENLLLCDAVMIFQGRASEGWLRMKLRELIKLPGYGRTNPLRGKAVYIAAPESPQKDRFQMHEALVIRNYAQFNPELVEPFVAKLRQARGGSQ